MQSLQFAKTILILLTVLVFGTSGTVSALSAPGGLLSGVSALTPITLEDGSVASASSPDAQATTSQRKISLSDARQARIQPSAENLAIRAVNPGYSLNGEKNVGELIELVNLTFLTEKDTSTEDGTDTSGENGENTNEIGAADEFSSEVIDLSGVVIVYTAKPSSAGAVGKSTVLYTFPEGSLFIGRSILLRFIDAPEVAIGTQDLTYDTSLAMAGSLTISLDENVISSLCWLGGEDCLPVFSTTVKSRSYTTILRDDRTGEYAHTNDYEPLYDPEESGVFIPEPDEDPGETGNSDGNSTDSADGDATDTENPEGAEQANPVSAAPACPSLEFSEILTYYTDEAAEQFIEFYNSSDTEIQLYGCKLRYKNKSYDLVSEPTFLSAYEYFVYRPAVKLTKNPTSENVYELIDADGSIVDTLTVANGQKSGTSLALMGYSADGSELWQITYAPTPGTPNNYQEFRSCPAGKVINEATGNCVNAANLETTLKDCGEGKYRNPLTGRCKSYDSSSSTDVTPCKEGYERNPETNRCRKIKENSGADYPVVPITDTEENTSFIAIWALAAVAGIGAAYVIFQFRKEILYGFRKVAAKFKR